MDALRQVKTQRVPYVVGHDHLRDIELLVNLVTRGQPDRVIVRSGVPLEWLRIPEDYRSLIRQSTLFTDVGRVQECAGKHLCFTTLASKPHIPYVCEVPAEEYARWHDVSFGKISDAVRESGVERLPPHLVHWLMDQRGEITWNNLSDLPKDKSINLLTDFAAHITQGRDLMASGFPDRQINSTIAVGHAGLRQRVHNAQSYATAHIHTVAHSKLPIRAQGDLSLNEMQKMMYRDNLYYLAVQKLASYTKESIAGSFCETGAFGFEVDTLEDKGVFARTVFQVKPSQHHPISLEQVLFATTNLNRSMRELWKFFRGKASNIDLRNARVGSVQKMMQGASAGGVQKFPRTPGFTVVIWWEEDRIAKIEIAPALHGPAERLNNAIVHFG